jgi:hypothetical protein
MGKQRLVSYQHASGPRGGRWRGGLVWGPSLLQEGCGGGEASSNASAARGWSADRRQLASTAEEPLKCGRGPVLMRRSRTRSRAHVCNTHNRPLAPPGRKGDGNARVRLDELALTEWFGHMDHLMPHTRVSLADLTCLDDGGRLGPLGGRGHGRCPMQRPRARGPPVGTRGSAAAPPCGPWQTRWAPVQQARNFLPRNNIPPPPHTHTHQWACPPRCAA